MKVLRNVTRLAEVEGVFGAAGRRHRQKFVTPFDTMTTTTFLQN